MYPKSFQSLIKRFSSLPSIGPKMAERLVLFLFKQNPADIEGFAEDLKNITDLSFCERCGNVSDSVSCVFCSDSRRDQKTICVVEEPLDIISIERTHSYRGLYHVLGGVIDSSEPGKHLRIGELLKRAESEHPSEIIIATNPTTEGDATALYLKRKLSQSGVKVTRLARGLSTGGDIEYADEMTITSALTNRREMS